MTNTIIKCDGWLGSYYKNISNDKHKGLVLFINKVTKESDMGLQVDRYGAVNLKNYYVSSKVDDIVSRLKIEDLTDKFPLYKSKNKYRSIINFNATKENYILLYVDDLTDIEAFECCTKEELNQKYKAATASESLHVISIFNNVELINEGSNNESIKSYDLVKYKNGEFVTLVSKHKTLEEAKLYKIGYEEDNNNNVCITYDILTRYLDDEDNIKESNEYGYHITKINKGVLGELSKIQEELDEVKDAEGQNNKIMVGCELADLYGAIELYASKYSLTMDDLKVMSDATKRAFKSGRRS